MRYIDVSHNTSLEVTARRHVVRKLVVIHTSMGYNSLSWLQGGSAAAGRPASSDFLIDRIGNIYQITRPGWYSYHSGEARWRTIQDADKTLNQSAVGVELEAAEHRGQRISDLQYIALARLCARLAEWHTLLYEGFVTHSMVALPPGRKSDPRSIDWGIVGREMVRPSKEGRTLVIPEVLP